MSKVILKNCDRTGPVWIEARLSNTGIPFNDLPPAAGFPRWIDVDESVDLEIGDCSELLFRRGLEFFEPDHEPILSHELFRVGNPHQRAEVKGYLWEFPRLPVGHLMNKCGMGVLREALGDVYGPRVESSHPEWEQEKLFKNAKYVIEPFYKAEGFCGCTWQIFLRVTDRKTNQVGERLIIETNRAEAFNLIDKIAVKDGMVVARPKKSGSRATQVELYRSRGFFVPVTTSIELILNGQPHPSQAL